MAKLDKREFLLWVSKKYDDATQKRFKSLLRNRKQHFVKDGMIINHQELLDAALCVRFDQKNLARMRFNSN